ncbi:MAG: hydroxymethylpyrimidine/phosphomethylpyrimidine kinase [Fibromonadaceae bacterium]|jgi:hydroxymethylpyrimidine/phosphomethylpyrimidine kinase|nr:hydroxymethylpyrimidine/phosphomethylpyrimidine kinase [Fibromonadaceae bacterium]
MFCLTIAGFDPSAGAGILADIKAFEHSKVYGQAVCTALTIQNEKHFEKPNWISWECIKSQLEILSRVRSFDYVKIGLVENPRILEKILKWLHKKYPKAFILWDPILKASSGFEFHNQKAITWQKLFTYVNLITPNFPEAELLGISKGSLKTAVLVKGGHCSNSKNSNDLLYFPKSPAPIKFSSKRIKGVDRHGSGCTLSALLLANLALGYNLETAILMAKKSMQRFFASGTGKLGSFHLLYLPQKKEI